MTERQQDEWGRLKARDGAGECTRRSGIGLPLESRRKELTSSSATRPATVTLLHKASRVDWLMVLMWGFVAFCFAALLYVGHAIWTECHSH